MICFGSDYQFRSRQERVTVAEDLQISQFDMGGVVCLDLELLPFHLLDFTLKAVLNE
jgi:hypothetical protein